MSSSTLGATAGNYELLAVFLSLFVIFIALGFWSSRFRKGNMSDIGEWALAGRRLGFYLSWFLVGADLYTAYTFIAIPEFVYEKGAIYFYAVPYVGIAFGVAMITMPRLWKIAKGKNYVTAVDMVTDKFDSKFLGILIAFTGIAAELPYIALQIYGMQAVLTVMIGQFNVTDTTTLTELALVIAFLILAAFTYTSGLRGAVTTAVMKDVLIFISVIVVIVVVPMEVGGFSTAFASIPAKNSFGGVAGGYPTLASLLLNGFVSLSIMSALALYLYPHAINGILSSNSTKKIRMSTALLPVYGIGLALLALFGILIYASPPALGMAGKYGAVTVVPSLIYAELPPWFAGLAFLAIFIGGLVPASIMAISQANLLTRNVVKVVKPNLKPETETRLSKWFSVMFKFIALGFIFLISPTYSLELQLVGGIIILQTLPSIFIGMYSGVFKKWAVGLGWFAGMVTGISMIYYANFVVLKASSLVTSLFTFSAPFGFLYIGLIALVVNIVVAIVITFVMRLIEGKGKASTA